MKSFLRGGDGDVPPRLRDSVFRDKKKPARTPEEKPSTPILQKTRYSEAEIAHTLVQMLMLDTRAFQSFSPALLLQTARALKQPSFIEALKSDLLLRSSRDKKHIKKMAKLISAIFTRISLLCGV